MKCDVKLSATEGKLFEAMADKIKEFVEDDAEASAFEKFSKQMAIDAAVLSGNLLGNDKCNGFLAKHEAEINCFVQDYVEKIGFPGCVSLSRICMSGDCATAEVSVDLMTEGPDTAKYLLSLLNSVRLKENTVTYDIISLLQDDAEELIKSALHIIDKSRLDQLCAILVNRYKNAIMAQINRKFAESGLKLKLDDIIADDKPPVFPDPQVSYVYEDGKITINDSSRILEMEFDAVVLYAIQNGKISTSGIQKNFNMGYNKAANTRDLMVKLGIAEYNNNVATIKALITKEQYIALKKDCFCDN